MRLIQAIVGSAFILFSGMCCMTKYLSAAIKGVGNLEWGNNVFIFLFKITPMPLNILMYAAFAVGMVFIIASLRRMKRGENLIGGLNTKRTEKLMNDSNAVLRDV